MLYLAWVTLGTVFYALSKRCKGKNARAFFTWGAAGFWMLLLPAIAPVVFSPILAPWMWPLLLLPALCCFIAGVSAIINEMRAQQRGEYTDAA